MIASLLLYPALHVTIIGALGGLVGAFAYLDRRIFFAESVTHGTFPGAVLGVVIAAALGFGHSGMSAALYVERSLGRSRSSPSCAGSPRSPASPAKERPASC